MKKKERKIQNYNYYIGLILCFASSVFAIIFAFGFKYKLNKGFDDFFLLFAMYGLLILPGIVSGIFFNFIDIIFKKIKDIYLIIEDKEIKFLYHKEIIIYIYFMVIFYVSGSILLFKNFKSSVNLNIIHLSDVILFLSIYLLMFCLFCFLLFIFFIKNMNRLRDFIKTKN